MIKKYSFYHICLTLQTTTLVLPPDTFLRADNDIFILSQGGNIKFYYNCEGELQSFRTAFSPFHHHRKVKKISLPVGRGQNEYGRAK